MSQKSPPPNIDSMFEQSYKELIETASFHFPEVSLEVLNAMALDFHLAKLKKLIK